MAQPVGSRRGGLGLVGAAARRRDESGQAGPMAIIVVGIVFLLLASLTQTVAGTVRDSRKGIARQEARAIAEAGVEEFFSRLIADPDYLRNGTFATTHPVLSAGGWWYFDVDNRLAPCPVGDRRSPCFQLSVNFNPGVQGGAVVESLGSSYCNTSRSECAGKVGLRSSVRRRSFLEFLIHADSESLEVAALPAAARAGYPVGCDRQADSTSPPRPAGCVDAAYHGVATSFDVVDGPIHSNDSRILICGQPRFTSTVEVFTPPRPGAPPPPGTPGSPWRPALEPGCGRGGSSGPVGGTFIIGPALSLPFEPRAGHPDPFVRAQTIAAAGNNPVSLAGDHDIVLDNDSMRIDGGATQDFPDSGVVFIGGNASVKGRIDGRLSIVAGGNITVTDDVVYACSGLGATPFPANCDDALGLNARGSIILQYRPADLTVHAAMASVTRSVFVDRWLERSDFRIVCTFAEFSASPYCGGAPLTKAPTLFIRGAIVGHYRGVYGAYDSGPAGRPGSPEGLLISGFTKNFVYDQRFRETIQPPYFVEPVSTAWARIDEVEVPPGLSGVTGSPASTSIPASTTTTVPGPTTTTTPGPTTTAGPTTTTVAPTSTTSPTTTIAPTTTVPPTTTTTVPPTTTTTACVLPGILC